MQRQVLQDLGHVQAGERDLRGAGEVELVRLERVDVRTVGREEAGAVHRLLAHEHRRQHRHVPVGGRAVEREAVERERDERRVADEVAEARAGEARSALELEAADLGVLRPFGRGVADAAELLCVLLGVAVGGRGIGRIRHLLEQRVPLGLGGRQLRLERAQLVLHRVQLLELLRRRLALELLPAPQLVDLREQGEPATRRRRAARRTSRPRPCGRARRGTAAGSARAARRSITPVNLQAPREPTRRPARRPAGRSSRQSPSPARARSRPRRRSRPIRSARRRSRRRRRRSSAPA